ncbi:hypothetical protein [Paenibacillus sp. KN14-4R]|uniref:hypothetical protein n=1 Tax=Paenibacillus sp. KN14-4R TaxID=3445773 RepID=UPI003F9F6C2A
MLALIIGCEIGFWLFVLGGLFFRYILRMKRVGSILLICTPFIDLLLAGATVIDLRNGAVATSMHGLAAVYIGVSIAFGHRMIKWADVRFAHHFAGGTAPVRAPKFGAGHARHERKMWCLHLLGCLIGCLLLYGMILLVGDESRTTSLFDIIRLWGAVLGIDFLWSFSYTLWPKQEKNSKSVRY